MQNKFYTGNSTFQLMRYIILNYLIVLSSLLYTEDAEVSFMFINQILLVIK